MSGEQPLMIALHHAIDACVSEIWAAVAAGPELTEVRMFFRLDSSIFRFSGRKLDVVSVVLDECRRAAVNPHQMPVYS